MISSWIDCVWNEKQVEIERNYYLNLFKKETQEFMQKNWIYYRWFVEASCEFSLLGRKTEDRKELLFYQKIMMKWILEKILLRVALVSVLSYQNCLIRKFTTVVMAHL